MTTQAPEGAALAEERIPGFLVWVERSARYPGRRYLFFRSRANGGESTQRILDAAWATRRSLPSAQKIFLDVTPGDIALWIDPDPHDPTTPELLALAWRALGAPATPAATTEPTKVTRGRARRQDDRTGDLFAKRNSETGPLAIETPAARYLVRTLNQPGGATMEVIQVKPVLKGSPADALRTLRGTTVTTSDAHEALSEIRSQIHHLEERRLIEHDLQYEPELTAKGMTHETSRVWARVLERLEQAWEDFSDALREANRARRERGEGYAAFVARMAPQIHAVDTAQEKFLQRVEDATSFADRIKAAGERFESAKLEALEGDDDAFERWKEGASGSRFGEFIAAWEEMSIAEFEEPMVAMDEEDENGLGFSEPEDALSDFQSLPVTTADLG